MNKLIQDNLQRHLFSVQLTFMQIIDFESVENNEMNIIKLESIFLKKSQLQSFSEITTHKYRNNNRQMSRISVYVRMRPLLQHQQDQESVKRRIRMDQNRREIRYLLNLYLKSVELSQRREKIFKFDQLLDDECRQNELYDSIDMDGLINRVVDGYHSTIFAYGQTGSGKTFTIEGPSRGQQLEGLIPRSIINLYKFINIKQQSNPNYRYTVFISFLQIYNEQIYDLIDINKKPLKMRWNKYQQFIVENLFEGQCRDQEEALRWWKKGQKSKIIDSHNMNKESSRSHCLLTLKVKCYELEDPSNCIQSKLEIVDLAGSERQKVTKSTGIVFREGIEINKSLFSLRQVIAALYESNVGSKSTQTLPPYRDSKLTSLLKQSIGGNAYCAMIACINPTMTHFEQSVQTLTYASMATYINNSPSKNIDPKIKENQLLKQHNYNLKEDIKKLSQHIQYLTGLLQKNKCEKCGNTNSVKLDLLDQKYRSKSKLGHRATTESDQNGDGSVKLPKFSNINDTRNNQSFDTKPKSILNDSQFLNETDSKSFKKKPDQQRSSTMQQTPKSTIQSVYQLKNPKEVLESITMIRDLIHTNTKLRDKIEMMRQQHEKMEKQTFQMMQENQLLRERWQMFGSNIKPESENENQAPISLYERLLKQQKGEGLMFSSSKYQQGKTQNMIQSDKNRTQERFISLKSFQKGSTTQAIDLQSLRPYRPYNQMLKSVSKRKKQTIQSRKRNLSTVNKKNQSFNY